MADSQISPRQFLKLIHQDERFTKKEIDLIEKALKFGAQHHKGQKRVSGVDYFRGHCLHVSNHLRVLEMSQEMIIAGMLHEILKLENINQEILRKEFGEEIAFLVENVHQLSSLKYRYYERHVNSLRKVFVTSSKDMRVVVIKLCDRYHNLCTLHHLPAEKQKRIAEESMLIHATIAQSLHINQLYQGINDLAFQYVLPTEYQRVQTLRKTSLLKSEKMIKAVYRRCLILLKENLDYNPVVDRRVKTTYSLYRKLLAKNWNIDEVYDIIALRIILKNKEDCYKVLGFIHAKWPPILYRFKDYIALPKSNDYQSLHTSIQIQNQAIEFQIKTDAMHQVAEFGTASHLMYKNRQPNQTSPLKRAQGQWQKKLKDIAQHKNLQDHLQNLETDLLSERIVVQTPRGDFIVLNEGATVLDFAFAIHTDLGLQAKGARINKTYKALKTPLNQGDIVEIIIDAKIKPTPQWLNWVKTPLARQLLRNYLKKLK